MLADSGGCLYAALRYHPSVKVGVRTNAWTMTAVASGTDPVIALAPGGAAQVAFWGSSGGLFWVAPPKSTETVLGSAAGTPSSHRAAFIAIPAKGSPASTGKPHIIYKLKSPNAGIYLASRDGKGSWSQTLVAADPPGKTCSPPGYSGQTCVYDYTEQEVSDLVASGNGDVRVLYASVRYQGTLMASGCSYGPCSWSTVNSKETGTLNLSWPASGTGGGFGTVTATANFLPVSQTRAAVDHKGRIHVAGSDKTGAGGVRYLLLGL